MPPETEYWLTVTGEHGVRHLAAETTLVGGDVPGRDGTSLCGRAVMDPTRAAYWWRRTRRRAKQPDIEGLPSCERCDDLVKVLGRPPLVAMPPATVALTRRLAAAVRELDETDHVLRQVQQAFGDDHPISVVQVGHPHRDCPGCDVLRAVRWRLARQPQGVR